MLTSLEVAQRTESQLRVQGELAESENPKPESFEHQTLPVGISSCFKYKIIHVESY
jgi:hypothetical protein